MTPSFPPSLPASLLSSSSPSLAPTAPTLDASTLALATFAEPLPWHRLSADHPHEHCSLADVFRALCAHPAHRLSGVAYDDDPALSNVERNWNEKHDSPARAFALVIDDVRLTLVEDHNDGYRSSSSTVELQWLGPVRNRFVPADVNIVWSPQVRWGERVGTQSLDASLVELRCPYTQALIVEVGTHFGDEYYPSMMTMFSAQAMDETARRAEMRVLNETAKAVQDPNAPARVRPRL